MKTPVYLAKVIMPALQDIPVPTHKRNLRSAQKGTVAPGTCCRGTNGGVIGGAEHFTVDCYIHIMGDQPDTARTLLPGLNAAQAGTNSIPPLRPATDNRNARHTL